MYILLFFIIRGKIIFVKKILRIRIILIDKLENICYDWTIRNYGPSAAPTKRRRIPLC